MYHQLSLGEGRLQGIPVHLENITLPGDAPEDEPVVGRARPPGLHEPGHIQTGIKLRNPGSNHGHHVLRAEVPSGSRPGNRPRHAAGLPGLVQSLHPDPKEILRGYPQ